MANGNGATPGDYTADDWTPQEWKAAWDRGAIGGNTGLPLFAPGSAKVNSRGDIYNPARVGAGGVNTGVRFPRGDEQPPAATPAAYKPGDPPPPAPANENINDPTPPAAPAQPPVTPGQFSPTPWGHPQVAGIPRMPGHGGVIGNPTPLVPPQGTLTPPPDKQGNRYWNPVGQQQPFGDQINRYAHEYGVPPALLSSLLRAESGFRADATGPPIPGKPYRAHGIAQFIPPTAATYHITDPNDPDQSIRAAANYLRDLYTKKGSWAGAVAAYNGAKSIDTSQYRGSPEGRALIANAVALDGGLVKAGPLVPPPQNYRPVSYTPQGGYPSMIPDRPSSMWGRDDPGMFEGPGAVPHQREIPGIMQGLAPLLMIGLSIFSKGAALPMLSAFAGYQNARNKRQEKDAKELKTFYQDRLKETKAKLGLEQGEAAEAMALPAGQQRDEALRRIAAEYGDSQLEGIINSGGDPEKLFQLRDKAYQDISKTNASERADQKLELQIEQDRLRNRREDARDEREKEKWDAEIKKNQQKQDEIDRENKEWGLPSSGASAAPAAAPDSDDGTTGDGDGDGGGSATAPTTTTPPAAAPTAEPSPTPTPTTTAPPPAEAPAAAPSGAPAATPPAAAPAAQPPAAAPAEGGGAAPQTNLPPVSVEAQGPQSPTDTLAHQIVRGQELPKSLPKPAADAAAFKATQLQGQLDGIAGNPDYANMPADQRRKAVMDAVRGVDPTIASILGGVLSGAVKPPQVGFGGTGRGFVNTITALAGAADPGFDQTLYSGRESIRKDYTPHGAAGKTMLAANKMSEAALQVVRAVRDMNPDDFKNITAQRWQEWIAKGFTGDPQFSNLFAAWRFYIEESVRVARQGTGAEGDIQAQVNATPPASSPSMILGTLKIDTANARKTINGYRDYWQDNRMPGEAPGYVAEADQTFGAIADNLDPASATFIPRGSQQLPEQVGEFTHRVGSTVGGGVVGRAYKDGNGNTAVWTGINPDNPSDPRNWRIGE